MWAWLRMLRNVPRASHKFDVAALLIGFDEAGRLKPALDLAERLGLKRPQPRPRSSGHRAAWLLAAARSAVPALPSGWQEPPPRYRLGWGRRVPSTARHITSPHAKRSLRMVASSPHCFTGKGGSRSCLVQTSG